MAFCLKTVTNKPLSFLLLVFTLIGCEDKVKRIDTSAISTDQSMRRFDVALFETGRDGFNANEVNLLRDDFPQFFPLFTQQIMRLSGPNDSLTAINLTEFVQDKNVRELYDSTQQVFAETQELEQQLIEGFKYYKHYFPDQLTPELITFISGFNYALVADDSLLAVGLDMYLGANSTYYPQLGMPQYRFRNMYPDQIVVDAMYSWLTTEYEAPNGDNLLKQMVYYGKVHYVLNQLLPDMGLHQSFGYTPEQLDWCLENEAQIWAFIVEQELLYSNENLEVRKFIGEGPFTAGFPEQAPAKLGHFIGWQMVKKYMKQKPELTLVQLMEDGDAQELLNQSKYKPKR